MSTIAVISSSGDKLGWNQGYPHHCPPWLLSFRNRLNQVLTNASVEGSLNFKNSRKLGDLTKPGEIRETMSKGLLKQSRNNDSEASSL